MLYHASDVSHSYCARPDTSTTNLYDKYTNFSFLWLIMEVAAVISLSSSSSFPAAEVIGVAVGTAWEVVISSIEYSSSSFYSSFSFATTSSFAFVSLVLLLLSRMAEVVGEVKTESVLVMHWRSCHKNKWMPQNYNIINPTKESTNQCCK